LVANSKLPEPKMRLDNTLAANLLCISLYQLVYKRVTPKSPYVTAKSTR